MVSVTRQKADDIEPSTSNIGLAEGQMKTDVDGDVYANNDEDNISKVKLEEIKDNQNS